MIVVSIFWLNSGEESVVYNCQNVKLLPQVVELSVLAYMMIKCFHYLYESQQDERISSHAAVVSTFRLTERRLIFFFGCFGTGGSGGSSKPRQRAAIAQSRNLPTNPCLWRALWRYMPLLDISCQLALGRLDPVLLVHSLCSNCLGWCRRYKPLQWR